MFCEKARGDAKGKKILDKKIHVEKGVGFGWLDIESYYKAAVIKMVWDWCRDRHIGQWTRRVQK